MKPTPRGVQPAAVLIAAVMLLACGTSGSANAASYHVDFERGDDAADGRSAATAWRHAPGDPAARGEAARTRLVAGDEVRFADGVAYRGIINVTSSGSPGAPIVFSGSGARGRGIIDGSEPARVVPCGSAAECGGASDWARLVTIVPATSGQRVHALFASSGALRPARFPDPADDFYRDEIDNMLGVDGLAMSLGEVRLPAGMARELARDDGSLALWVKPNRVVERPVLFASGDVARFNPDGLAFYTDRTVRVAALGTVALIDRDGEYVVLPSGRVVARLAPDAAEVSIGAGRGGFRLRGASNIVIRGLEFRHMSDGNALAPAGVAIFAEGGSGLVVENNLFRQFLMEQGQGAIVTRRVSDLTIRSNDLEAISLGSGMRISGPAAGIVIENNTIRRIGRTGIMLMGTENALVRSNHISDVRDVHGNGLSAYLDNHDVRFVANTVIDAKQPATFKGAGAGASRDNSLVFANNLLVAMPDALGALMSWGNNTRGVLIRNNVLLGGRAGLRLNDNDSDVTVLDNLASGLLFGRTRRSDWTIKGNAWTVLSWQQKKLAPEPVTNLPVSLAADLARGEASTAVCAVIRKHSAPTAHDEAAGAIGAEIRCP